MSDKPTEVITKCFAGIAFAVANANMLMSRATRNDNLHDTQVWLPFAVSMASAVVAFTMLAAPGSFEGNAGKITFGVLMAAGLGCTMGITANTSNRTKRRVMPKRSGTRWGG